VRIAVVASGYSDPWREDHLLARRISGALACSSDVDLLLPGGARRVEEHDGAVRVLLFRSTPFEPRRRIAWRKAALGIDPRDPLRLSPLARRRDLPAFVENQLLNSEGGDAPELYNRLRSRRYDLTVFVGYHTPVTYNGVRALADDCRVVLVPASRDDSTAWLRIHDEIFERSERILVCTESERTWILERIGPEGASRVENAGFVVGVNSLGLKTEPPEYHGERYVIVVRNWYEQCNVDRFKAWASSIEEQFGPDLGVRFAGPGAEKLRYGLGRTSSRLDIWRWVSRAVALLDPSPQTVVGREVLEAYLYGMPVVVHAHGGANREHAEQGDGGVWFRTNDELYGAVHALLDDDVRMTLGQQGRSYAEDNFGDPDTYIKRVAAALFG
jgi:glycosyltransferase involved in cell wall biosynthesis